MTLLFQIAAVLKKSSPKSILKQKIRQKPLILGENSTLVDIIRSYLTFLSRSSLSFKDTIVILKFCQNLFFFKDITVFLKYFDLGTIH